MSDFIAEGNYPELPGTPWEPAPAEDEVSCYLCGLVCNPATMRVDVDGRRKCGECWRYWQQQGSTEWSPLMVCEPKPSGLPWFGGKSPLKHKAPWIVSHLPPWRYQRTYVEPFAGQLGVLLSQKASRIELANDANQRLVNWWRVVREQPEEFGTMLELTHQKSRVGFAEAKRDLDCDDPVRRAVSFLIVVLGCVQSTDIATGWTPTYRTGSGKAHPWNREDVRRLHERTKNVQLECADGVDLLERLADEESAVIYCDPPYSSADTSNYRFLPDYDRLREALLAQRGQVAVSGYGSEWGLPGMAARGVEDEGLRVCAGRAASLAAHGGAVAQL